MKVLIFLLIMVSVTYNAFGKMQTPNLNSSATSSFPIECSVYINNGNSEILISSNLNDIFVNGGSKTVSVMINGKQTVGFVSLVNGHDNNFHGLKYIDLKFGNQLSVVATLSPLFGLVQNRIIRGEGPGNYFQYGQRVLGNAYCRVYSNCNRGDPRLCSN